MWCILVKRYTPNRIIDHFSPLLNILKHEYVKDRLPVNIYLYYV